MTIVINVKDNLSPTQDDLLIYDAKEGKWKCVSKALFLTDSNKKIKALEDEVASMKAELEAKIDTNGQNIKKMADIIKENLL